MYTLEAFSKEQIEEMYKNLILCSIETYHTLPDSYKSILEKKYQNAMELKLKLGIMEDKSIDKFAFLQQSKEQVEEIKEQNQPIIEDISNQILVILENEMPKNLTEFEKCKYIFDYITETMNYSNDWYSYCNSIPSVNGINFSFYQGIPQSTSYEGLLVTRQGNCEEIANLIIYLGRKLGVYIGKETCYHNGNMHAINYIMVDKEKSYLDATSVIQGNKKPEEAFLVSREKLNQKGDYQFKEEENSITIGQIPTNYNIHAVMNKTNALMPNIRFVKTSPKAK